MQTYSSCNLLSLIVYLQFFLWDFYLMVQTLTNRCWDLKDVLGTDNSEMICIKILRVSLVRMRLVLLTSWSFETLSRIFLLSCFNLPTHLPLFLKITSENSIAESGPCLRLSFQRKTRAHITNKMAPLRNYKWI